MAGCHTQTLVIRGAQTSHMTAHLASIQQRRAKAVLRIRQRRMPATCLPEGLRADRIDGSGRRVNRTAPAPIVNQTKLAVVAVMQELDRPVTSSELQRVWADHKDLKIFEYHLCTLVKAKVAEVVYGPELHFRLTG